MLSNEQWYHSTRQRSTQSPEDRRQRQSLDSPGFASLHFGMQIFDDGCNSSAQIYKGHSQFVPVEMQRARLECYTWIRRQWITGIDTKAKTLVLMLQFPIQIGNQFFSIQIVSIFICILSYTLNFIKIVSMKTIYYKKL